MSSVLTLTFREMRKDPVRPYVVVAATNARAGDVCPASASERGILQRACVREHGAHERFLHVHRQEQFLHVHRNDEYLCGYAHACELPPYAGAGANALRCL